MIKYNYAQLGRHSSDIAPLLCGHEHHENCFFIIWHCVVHEVIVSHKLRFSLAYAVPSRDQNTSECYFTKLGGVNLRLDERQSEATEELHDF